MHNRDMSIPVTKWDELAAAILCFAALQGFCQGVPAARTQVVMLGTGTPYADPDRSGPATAVVVNGTPYLVDCGPGVIRRVAQAHKNGVEGLTPQKIGVLFITHLHSDHTVGYPDVIFTPAVTGRPGGLEVYGPKGLDAMTASILKAWEKDIDIRLHGLEQGNAKAYVVHPHEIRAGVVYKDANVPVIAFPVKHGTWDESWGYRFDTPDKSIVISGDTSPTDEIVKQCHGCDLLIHEVYSVAGLKARPSEHASTTGVFTLRLRNWPALRIRRSPNYWCFTTFFSGARRPSRCWMS